MCLHLTNLEASKHERKEGNNYNRTLSKERLGDNVA